MFVIVLFNVLVMLEVDVKLMWLMVDLLGWKKMVWVFGLVEIVMRIVFWLYLMICKFWFIWDLEILVVLFNIMGNFFMVKLLGLKGCDVV